MKFIELFGGVGGFSLGIKRAFSRQEKKTEYNKTQRDMQNSQVGTREWEHDVCECVGYYEWDKYAVETYNKNFVTNYEPTDITKVDAQDIPDHDILCGGFPCQSFSIAGKRRGFEDTRGTMFYEIVRIIRHKRPRILFLENVKGLLNHDRGKTFATILSSLDELGYDVEWQVLNSKHFGVPQNRERVFIIGHLRGEPFKKVFPIRESSTEINQTQQQISATIHAGYYKQGRDQQYVQYDPNQKGNRSQQYRVYNKEVAEPTMTSSQSSDTKIEVHSLYPRTGNPDVGGTGHLSKQTDETYCLDTGNAQAIEIKIMDLYNNKEHSDRSPTLTEPHHNTLRVRDGTQIRRLTPVECERLQGFPDGWTDGVSDTQRYKQMGNAVTTNVIEAIARRLGG